MRILVCIKQILDPEVPVRDFQINRDRLEAEAGSANQVTNIFCENALETALQFREAVGEGTITALSFGQESAEDSLRKALAMKVDEACLVVNDGHSHPDSAATAQVLATAIKKLGEFDLIVTGRESGDWGAGQVGGCLAEQLCVPCVSFVDEIKAVGEGFEVRRQTESGWERYLMPRQLVVTITNSDRNLPRIPKTRDIMMSHRKPLTKWTLQDIGLSADLLEPVNSGVRVVDLFIPTKNNTCDLVEGDSLDAKIESLADKMAEIVRGI